MASVPNSDLVARILFNASAVGFAISEVSIRVRSAASRSGSKVDHGSIVAVLVAMTIGVLAAVWFEARVPAAKISYQGVTLAVGLVAMWLGIALRQWAVWTLGRLFTIVVRVEANQTVVATGPYRWVRHPSYTGLLMTLFGEAPGSCVYPAA
jgi:protein-S-isoprenylcysteine O-methyltransferase Ste14